MSDISSDPIVGASVEVVISEPWELALPAGEEARPATVVGLEREDHVAHEVAIAIRLQRPLRLSGQEYRSIIFRPRSPSELDSLKGGSPIGGTYVGMSVNPDDPGGPGLIRRYEDWRGGLAGRADLRLVQDGGSDGVA